MEVVFSNGTEEQQAAFNTALSLMLDFDFARFPQTLTIEFSPDPVPEGGGGYSDVELAATYSDEHRIVVRDDFPHFVSAFGTEYGPHFHYETVVHELGHYFTYLLSEEGRTAVETLMGLPPGASMPGDEYGVGTWESQGPEMVAEQFKAAFLPNSDPSRADFVLPIALWPQFRAIYRGAYTVTVGSTTDPSAFAVDLWTNAATPTGGLFVLGGPVYPYAPMILHSNEYVGAISDPIPITTEAPITAPDEAWFTAGGDSWRADVSLNFTVDEVVYEWQRHIRIDGPATTGGPTVEYVYEIIYVDGVLTAPSYVEQPVKGLTWLTFTKSLAEILAVVGVTASIPDEHVLVASGAIVAYVGGTADLDWGIPSTIVQAYDAGSIGGVPMPVDPQEPTLAEIEPTGRTSGRRRLRHRVTGRAINGS